MSLKLTYFPVKGAAELSRYILAQGGAEYEDVRKTGEDWMAFKPLTPFGQMPILEVDGVLYSQSVTIARYLANKYKLAGSNSEEQLLADMIVDTVRVDIVQNLVFKTHFEKDEAKKAELKKTADEKLPAYLEGLEKLVRGENTFLASGLSWADIALYNMVTDFYPVAGFTLDAKYTKLNAVINNVKKQPKIAEWITKRPESSM